MRPVEAVADYATAVLVGTCGGQDVSAAVAVVPYLFQRSGEVAFEAARLGDT
ncbi:MAG: hypothetical protein ACYCVV_10930 [Acidimicrobiales bacterium]